MSDESFGENFVWYEWGFVAPEDLEAVDTEADRSERGEVVSPMAESAGWDTVWAREHR